jgi:glycosyltransferase involved in cell wall biosynthesis
MVFPLSVIVPNFNDARFLPTALDALLSQSEPAQEIFVVDDASRDESPEIIKDYARRYSVIRPVLLDRNVGVVAIMNRFAREAKTDFIYFGAADDYVLPGYFDTARHMLEKHPGAGLCSALCKVVDEPGRDRGVFHSPVPMRRAGFIDQEQGRSLLLHDDSWIMGNTAIYRREAILAEGGFNATLHGFSDGFMHRLMILQHGVCFIPQPYVCLRQRKGSMSDRTNTDPDLLAKVISSTTELMLRDPKHRFPPGYAEKWKQRMRFGALRSQLGRSWIKRSYLSVFGLAGIDHAIVVSLLALRARKLAESYLFLRLRAFDLWAMIDRRVFRERHFSQAGANRDQLVCNCLL